MKKFKICVACGSGMATSHLITEQLVDMLNQRGIQADVKATKVSDIGDAHNYDLIVTSTILSADTYDVPVVRALSFLTGIGMEQDFEKIVQELEKLPAED